MTPYQRRVFTGRARENWVRITDALRPDYYCNRPFTTAEKIGQKIEGCCGNAVIQKSESRDTCRIAEFRCKCRLCPRCGAIRSAETAARIECLTLTMDSPRLLTLGMRSTDAPLREQIDALRAAITRLRARHEWKKHIRGGLYVLEITHNPDTGRWHPHAHAIIDGQYWPQARALETWQEVVGDQASLDIRKVHSASRAARYVAKYVAKTNELAHSIPAAAVHDLAEALHGLRIASTFGSMHNVKAASDGDDPAPPDEHPNDWQTLASANELAARAATDPEAEAFMHALKRRQRSEHDKRLTQWWRELCESIRARGQPVPHPRYVQPDLPL